MIDAGAASDYFAMRDVTQLRATLDGFAARYAAIRITRGADSRPLWHAFEQMERAARQGEYEQFIVADRELHRVICLLAGVKGLLEVWETCREHWDGFRIETIRSCFPDLEVLLEAHRPIVESISNGRSHVAEDAARSHLDPVWYRLAETQQTSVLTSDPLERACAYLAFHLQESITLEALAKKVASTSAGHLARLFREKTQSSFTVYLRRLRMTRAAQLLVETTLPVSHIGRMVGYKDASRFSRHFREHYAVSPRNFRDPNKVATD